MRVELRDPGDLATLPPFDLAHVFNLQMPDTAAEVFGAVAGRPVAFSPIYWDTYAFWFEAASESRPLWRWAARLLGKERARAKYIAWQRSKEPRNASWRLQRSLLEQAGRVLPNSAVEGELLRDIFALPASFRDRIDVIPNAIDTAAYGERPAPSAAFLAQHGLRDFVMQTGTISPVKNQLGLIEALFDLPVPIVFVGHTPEAMQPYAERCRARARERGNVLFIDHLPASELPGIYALAAVHVLPSWRETPGLVSLEAAACGARIVSTSIGSAQEYFGEIAWYCHPSDTASIRRAVEAALAAPPTDALRRRVIDTFTWQRTAEATLASYERLLGRVAPRSPADTLHPEPTGR